MLKHYGLSELLGPLRVSKFQDNDQVQRVRGQLGISDYKVGQLDEMNCTTLVTRMELFVSEQNWKTCGQAKKCYLLGYI